MHADCSQMTKSTQRLGAWIGSPRLRKRLAAMLAGCYVLLLSGCRQIPMPNRVSNQEYEVYAAWASKHLAKKTPQIVYLFPYTNAFDPAEGVYSCGPALHEKDGVSWSLIRPLQEQGEARFPLDHFRLGSKLRVPWKYEEIDNLPPQSQNHTALSFSRVAFNRAGDTGLFSVFTSYCAGGQCGGNGGAVIAKKVDGRWSFKGTDCFWDS